MGPSRHIDISAWELVVKCLFFCAAIYNLNMWECACHKKPVAFSACHNLYRQSVLLINTSCLIFSSHLTGHIFSLWLDESYLACSARQPNYPSFLERKYHLFLSLFVSCIPTQTHTETHGWFGTAVLPATSSLSFPPLSPWRQASRAGWFQTVVNQHRLKREGEGGSLCV